MSGEQSFTLDVTDDVQWWYANGGNLNNFGWVLTSHETDLLLPEGIRLMSDDATDGRPVLDINVIPGPATLALFALGLCVVGVRRLRRRR